MKTLLTKHEAASRLSISVRQLENYIRLGNIPVCRLGRRCVRIEQAAVEQFIETISAAKSEA